jgi:hypothetical protein
MYTSNKTSLKVMVGLLICSPRWDRLNASELGNLGCAFGSNSDSKGFKIKPFILLIDPELKKFADIFE